MITVDELIVLIRYSFPIVVIVAVGIWVIARLRKEKKNNFDTVPAQFFGMRPPTDDEAEKIKKQICPRILKPVAVLSLVFLPLVVIIGGAAASMYEEADITVVYIMGSVAGAVLLMYLALLSMHLIEIRDVVTKHFTVCDCYFSDVQQQWRVTPRGMPVKVYHATISDQIGLKRELDLPKDLQFVRVGTPCLLVVYDEEWKVNKNRPNEKSLLRRGLYVPHDL